MFVMHKSSLPSQLQPAPTTVQPILYMYIYQTITSSKALNGNFDMEAKSVPNYTCHILFCVNSLEGVRTMKPLSNANYSNQINDFALNLDEHFCHNVPLGVRPDFQVSEGNF